MLFLVADHVRGIACKVVDHVLGIFGLNDSVNRLQNEVNKLQQENEKLKEQVAKLDQVEQRLRETQSKLQDISVFQGKSVDTLVQQVREFKKIQERVKESLEAKVIQNLISVVLTADADRDFMIDPEEIDELKIRLKAIDGVDFSEKNFHKALVKSGFDPLSVNVRKGGFSIQAVLDVMKNLMDDSVPEKDNIFTIHTEEVLR